MMKKFGLRFRITREQHGELPILKPQHDGIRIRFVAAGFHLLFGEEWFTRSQHGKKRSASEIVFLQGLGLFVLGAALFKCGCVLVEEAVYGLCSSFRGSGRRSCFAVGVGRRCRRRRREIHPVVDHGAYFDAVQYFVRAANVIGVGVRRDEIIQTLDFVTLQSLEDAFAFPGVAGIDQDRFPGGRND